MWQWLKSSLISVILVFVVLSVNAQSESSRFKLGFYGGANFSEVSPGTEQSIIVGSTGGAKIYNDLWVSQGWQFGGLIRIDIAKKLLTLSFEPLYTNRKFGYGTSYSYEGRASMTKENNFTHNLTYIEAPLFLELRRGGHRWEPYFKVGGYYGILQNALTTVQSREDNPDFTTGKGLGDTDLLSTTDAFLKIHAGIAAGVGLRCNLGGVKLGLDLTYRHGLDPISNTDTQLNNNELVGGYYDQMDNLSLKNLAISIQIIGGMNILGDYAKKSKRGVVPCPSGH